MPPPARAIRPLAPAGDVADRLDALGRALNADLSGVRLHPDSPAAARIGARAFARGDEVHFAPGEFRPGTPDGDRLLAHELAHVVQQRTGRVRPTHRTDHGEAVDTSPALEAEADAQAARAVAGAPARPGAPPSPATPGAEVIQGVFVASAKLTPVDDEDAAELADEDEIGLADLRVDAVRITHKRRPPTRIAGSQGRHTLAWRAKVLFWERVFGARTAAEVAALVLQMAEEDERVDVDAGEQGAAGRAARAPVLRLARQLSAADYTASATSIIADLNRLLTEYVKAYQQSSFAAFPSTNPKGKGEASTIKRLQEVETGRLAMSDSDLLVTARRLVDTSSAGAGDKVVRDAVQLITTLFPAVAARLQGARATLREVLFPASSAVLHDDSGAGEEDDEPEDTEVEGLEPFLIRVASSRVGGDAPDYGPGELFVEAMGISDERPDTQFGSRQMSHTVAWSLERLAWSAAFSGCTVEELFDELLARLDDEDDWSPDATSDRLSSDRDVLRGHLTALGEERATLPVWTNLASDAVEQYVALYQRAPFATFGTEPKADGDSNPRGQGEGPALRRLRELDGLAAAGPLGADRLPELQRAVQALVDVPQLDMNRAKVDVDRLGDRFAEELAAAFPNLALHHAGAMQVAYGAAAEQSDAARKLSRKLREGRRTRSQRRAEKVVDPKTGELRRPSPKAPPTAAKSRAVRVAKGVKAGKDKRTAAFAANRRR